MSTPQAQNTSFSMKYRADWIQQVSNTAHRLRGQVDVLLIDAMGTAFSMDVMPGVVFFPLQVQLTSRNTTSRDKVLSIDWSCVGMPVQFQQKERRSIPMHGLLVDWSKDGLLCASQASAGCWKHLCVDWSNAGLPSILRPQRTLANCFPQQFASQVRRGESGPSAMCEDKECEIFVDWSVDGLPTLRYGASPGLRPSVMGSLALLSSVYRATFCWLGAFVKGARRAPDHRRSAWKTLSVDWSADGLPFRPQQQSGWCKPQELIYDVDWSADGLPMAVAARTDPTDDCPFVLDWSRDSLPAELQPKNHIKGKSGAREQRAGERGEAADGDYSTCAHRRVPASGAGPGCLVVAAMHGCTWQRARRRKAHSTARRSSGLQQERLPKMKYEGPGPVERHRQRRNDKEFRIRCIGGLAAPGAAATGIVYAQTFGAVDVPKSTQSTTHSVRFEAWFLIV